MPRRAISIAFAAMAAVVMTLWLAGSPTFAKSDSKAIKATITLTQPAKLAGKELKAGEYQVLANESSVTLRRDGRVVAETPVQWVNQKEKSSDNSLVLEGDIIREIHFAGKAGYISIP